jgi:hypothetical protein
LPEKYDSFNIGEINNLLGSRSDGEIEEFIAFEEEFDGEVEDDLIETGIIGIEWREELDFTKSSSVSPPPTNENSPVQTSSYFRFTETDEVTKQKVSLVLASEFDREIQYRLQDLCDLEYKLQHAHQMLLKLNTCIGYREDEDRNEVNESRGLIALGGLSTLGKYWSSSNRPDRNSRSRQSAYVFVQTSDNVFLKLVCPSCRCSQFASKAEFLNHCRQNHKLKFPNYEEAVKQCGVVVDASNVPQNDPCRKEKTGFSYRKRKASDSFTKPVPSPSKKQRNGDHQPAHKSVMKKNSQRL